MAGSTAFEAVCSELAGFPNMDRWTARGTLQLALMDAGLEAANASPAQLLIVVDRLLPRQLQSHNGADVGAICTRLRDVLALMPESKSDSPEAVFARLGT